MFSAYLFEKLVKKGYHRPMDERRTIIRGLEEKNRAETDARNRLLEGLGEALIQRIEEEGAVSELAAGIVAEYRGLRKEIADSAEAIKALEADSQRLKDLDDNISAKEGESSRLAKEFAEACTRLGKAFLSVPDITGFSDLYRQQEEILLAKIDEQEEKTRELEEREGGVLAWLGKNAQMAVAKALLLKNRSALQKVYRSAGEQFVAAKPVEELDGEAGEAALNAEELKGRLDVLTDDLLDIKGERRKLSDTFGTEGTPSRRISGLQKRVTSIKHEFPGLYLRLGSLAARSGNRETFSPVLTEDDKAILERAASLQAAIDTSDLKIKKVKAAISIDNEKAEIERMEKAIAAQRHKIAAANEEIEELERQISDAELNITELKNFITEANNTEQ